MAFLAALLSFTGLLLGTRFVRLQGEILTYNCSYYNEIECGGNLSFGIVGHCKKTYEVCSETDPDTPPSIKRCYMLYEPSDNGTEIVHAQGCWLDNHDKLCDSEDCRYYKVPQRGLHYCCCRGDFCNSKSGPPRPTPSTTTQTIKATTLRSDVQSHTPVGGDSKKSIVIIIAAAVGPVVVLAAACLLGFWWWSRRQGGDVLNVDGDMTELEQYKAPERAVTGSPEPTIDLSSLNVIQKIGGGRFAEVWKAALIDDLVAVKIFPQHEKQSWMTEKDVYTNPEIKHENLRRFLAAECRDDGDSVTYWMILDFHELGSLSDYLKAHVIMLEDVCKMAASVAAGLAYLHSEIVSSRGLKPAIAHRDLKSRNVLVKNDGTCCICDLGLSIKFQPATSLTEAQGQVGTVRYMAPEVLEGAITFNRESFLRIDVYALGLLIWEMMSRCSVQGPVHEYKQPFEEEVGLHPNIEQMREAVVSSRMRPKLPKGWDCVQPLETLVETVVECWDHDAEARLTAQCVEERANWCLRFNSNAVHPPTVSLQGTGDSEELSRHQNGTANGHLRNHTRVDQEETNESNDLPFSLHNGHIPVHSSETKTARGHINMNGMKQVRLPFYPQDGSASPPPYSAVPPSYMSLGKMTFKVVNPKPRKSRGTSDSSSYAETSL